MKKVDSIKANTALINFFKSPWILVLAIANCVLYLFILIDNMKTLFDNMNSDFFSNATLSPVFGAISAVILFILYGSARNGTTKAFNGCFVVVKVFAIINIVTISISILLSLIASCNSIAGSNGFTFINLILIIGQILVLIANILINNVATYQRNNLVTGINSSKYLIAIAVIFFIISSLTIFIELLLSLNFAHLFAAVVDIFMGITLILYAKVINNIPPYVEEKQDGSVQLFE